MEDNENIKKVIILDEKKKNNKPADEEEVQELLEELNRYADSEDDGEERVVTERTRIRIRRRRKLTKLNKHIMILGASLIVLIAVAAAAVLSAGNNYRVPVSVYEEFLNSPGYDGEELSYAYGNGLAERRFRKLRQILRETDDTYINGLNETVVRSRDEYEDNRKRYGDDFKYTVHIDSMVPLNRYEILSLTNDFSGIIRDINNSSFVRSDSGDLTMAVIDVTSALENARITKGYHLYCTQNVTGSSDDGPVSEMSRCEFTVVKLGGRWIMWDKIYDILRLSY